MNIKFRLYNKSFLIILFFMLNYSYADSDLIATHRRQLKFINNEISTLQQKIDNAKDKHETLLEELSKTETKISFLNVNLKKIDSKIKDLPDSIVTLQQKIKTNEQVLNEQKKNLAKQIRAAYISGQRDFLKLLLQEDSPEHISRFMEYYKAINNTRHKLTKTVYQKTDELNQARDQIKDSVGDLESVKQSQLQQKKSLQSSKNYRTVIIKEINSELSSQQKKLNALKKSKQSLSKVLSTLEDIAQVKQKPQKKHQQFSEMMHKLSLPIHGKIVNRFGENIPESGIVSNGFFIEAAAGGSVKAFYSGRVVFSDWLRGFGLVLIIDHGDGYMSLYAHNEQLYKHAGDLVQTKEPIAIIGRMGGQLKPSLYFELRHNGKAIDPSRWMS